MKYGKLLGWGIVIYAVVFLAWTGFLTYGVVEGYTPFILNLVVLLAVTYIAGRTLHLPSWSDIMPYSIGWAIVVMILDTVFVVPFSGWTIYSDWHVWLGYALVVIVPLFTSTIAPWRLRGPTLS